MWKHVNVQTMLSMICTAAVATMWATREKLLYWKYDIEEEATWRCVILHSDKTSTHSLGQALTRSNSGHEKSSVHLKEYTQE